MAELNSLNAVIALCDYLASAPLNLARTGSAIALFAHQFDEKKAADPYTVLRLYPGSPLGNHGVPMISVQMMTVAKVPAVGIDRASKLYDRLRDASGRPIRNLAISGFTVKGILNLIAPGQIGVDASGRAEVVCNFDMAYIAA